MQYDGNLFAKQYTKQPKKGIEISDSAISCAKIVRETISDPRSRIGKYKLILKREGIAARQL